MSLRSLGVAVPGERSNEGDNTRILPVDIADNFFGQPPVTIEDVSFREQECAEVRGQCLVGVARDWKRKVILGNEFLQCLRILVHTNADYHEPGLRHFFGASLEAGLLLETGRA